MTATAVRNPARRMELEADRAADLMTANPVSIRADASVREAMNMLTLRGISAAPVADPAGRPIGVISQTDLLIHERNRFAHRRPVPAYQVVCGESLDPLDPAAIDDPTLVRDVMTPAVFSVRPETAARVVVDEMLQLRVHRLFVVDHAGVLLGVISMTDVLRHLTV